MTCARLLGQCQKKTWPYGSTQNGNGVQQQLEHEQQSHVTANDARVRPSDAPRSSSSSAVRLANIFTSFRPVEAAAST